MLIKKKSFFLISTANALSFIPMFIFSLFKNFNRIFWRNLQYYFFRNNVINIYKFLKLL